MFALLNYVSYIFILCSLLTTTHINAEILDDFDYKDPDSWVKNFPECGGENQSPVALNLKSGERVNYSSPLVFKGAGLTPSSIRLENNGRHVIAHIDWEVGQDVATFSGGPLGDNVYEFSMVVYSWDRITNQGSEDVLDGKRTPMGILYIFFNMKYDDLADSWSKEDGLLIVDRLVEEADGSENGNDIHKPLEDIMLLLPKLREPGSAVESDSYAITNFLTPTEIETKKVEFLAYKGSRAIPPCQETATWLVNIETVFASSEIIEEFGKVKLLANDMKNHRPLQPLNGRQVSRVTGDFTL